jgi:thiamine-monophosphate kinase
LGIVINVTVLGQVDRAKALRRGGAKVDDDIWISGTLGAPDIALQLLQGKLPPDPDMLAAVRPALDRPMPPWYLGQALAGIAHAAIDISDGLAQDLGHVLDASGCGAELEYATLPVHAALQGLPPAVEQAAVLGGGDVYQLCFTASRDQRDRIQAVARQASVRVRRVGRITAEPGLRIRAADGASIIPVPPGFDHFA